MNATVFRIWFIAAVALAELLLPSTGIAQMSQPAQKRSEPISESDSTFRYRLFETDNMWTFVLLDTATGRAWQVQYSVGDAPTGRAVINNSSLLPEGVTPKNGRFTLQRTQNMYNFLLLDREDSRIWQLQWSLESQGRGIIRSIPLQR